MASELTGVSSVSSYRDYQAEAHELVKNLIRAALEKLAAEQSQQQADKPDIEQSSVDVGTPKPVLIWPSGKDFTIEKGLEAIDKFVKVNIDIDAKVVVME